VNDSFRRSAVEYAPGNASVQLCQSDRCLFPGCVLIFYTVFHSKNTLFLLVKKCTTSAVVLDFNQMKQNQIRQTLSQK